MGELSTPSERAPLIGAGEQPALPEREVSGVLYSLLRTEMVASLQAALGAEGAEAKLRAAGFATGLRLVTRLTASRFPIMTERDVIKFMCKELWPSLFHRQASRLQVDKQGRFIIYDNSFRWLENLPSDSQ
ncbi:unnamed protein product, partial [Effrenium voratum]